MKQRFQVTVYCDGKTNGPRWVDAETNQEAAGKLLGVTVIPDEDFADGKHFLIPGRRNLSIWSRPLSEP